MVWGEDRRAEGHDGGGPLCTQEVRCGSWVQCWSRAGQASLAAQERAHPNQTRPGSMQHSMPAQQGGPALGAPQFGPACPSGSFMHPSFEPTRTIPTHPTLPSPTPPAHIEAVAVEQLASRADPNVAQQHHVARLQLLLNRLTLHKPHLPHLACRKKGEARDHGRAWRGVQVESGRADSAMVRDKGI